MAPDDRVEGMEHLSGIEVEERFNRRIFLELPDPAVIVNRLGEIERVNDKAELFFIRERAEMVGKNLKLLIPDRFHAVHDEHIVKYFASPQKREMGASLDLWAVDSMKHEHPVTIHLSPILHGSKGILTLAVLRIKPTTSIKSETK